MLGCNLLEQPAEPFITGSTARGLGWVGIYWLFCFPAEKWQVQTSHLIKGHGSGPAVC